MMDISIIFFILPLIAPYGIEIKAGENTRSISEPLIAPYGIEMIST